MAENFRDSGTLLDSSVPHQKRSKKHLQIVIYASLVRAFGRSFPPPPPPRSAQSQTEVV